MKKILVLPLLAMLAMGSLCAQTACYWVLLTDKQGVSFDPYAYFDTKAIERYQQCGADLYDVSNYPVSPAYERQVAAIATEDLGPSRWLNAVAVMATPEQVAQIERLPFVREVKMVGGQWQLASKPESPAAEPEPSEGQLTDQLVRMGGAQFRAHGIDGKGIRIAVFDGGFPHVNTHLAFKHLRDEGRILKTWNFPDKKENVYLAGSHGTMTLSCIAGRLGDKQIGLATGAEFLLARTEIGPEPFKEEVWWMQAMEWADKNGAQIISSSLGYGKERHYTYEMDGRSYVAKAANMAARKGMLVCNSAGNEGDDNRWKTIITPADADSVLCVGGIEDRLDVYRHISFSSYGPGADGRRKPNVCAFGHAYVADHAKDSALTQAYGTSFSCPLVAGFAACAWQTRPQASAMEMMQAIEQSADLYPYYDYAFGYGVPQASYFVEEKGAKERTFQFVDKDFYVAVVPTEKFGQQRPAAKLEENPEQAEHSCHIKPTFFLKAHDRKGRVEKFYSLEFEQMGPSQAIAFRKSALYRRTLVVHYNGFTDSLTLSDQANRRLRDQGQMGDFEYVVIDTAGYLQFDYEENMSRTPEDNRVKEKPWGFQVAALYGAFLPDVSPYSDQFQLAFRAVKPIHKRYLLGMGVNFTFNTFRLDSVDVSQQRLARQGVGLELFQRVVLRPGGQVTHQGFHWDLGLAGDWFFNTQHKLIRTDEPNCASVSTIYHNPTQFDNQPLSRFALAATTRLTWDWIGLFATWNLFPNQTPLPRLTAGLQLNL